MTKKKVGIASLYESIQAQQAKDKKAAKLIFNLVTREEATHENLASLVTQGSLFELILMSVDLSKKSRAVVNQAKSKIVAKSEKARMQQILHSWLEKNIHKYKGFLDNCADDAILNLPKLGRSHDWVRKEITAYLRLKKQVVNSPAASSLPEK